MFKLMNGCIKSIGEKKDSNLLREESAPFNTGTSDLDNFLTNDLLTIDQ